MKMQELRRKKLIDRRARVRARCGGGEGKECGEAENADWRAKKVYTRRKLCYNEEKQEGMRHEEKRDA